MIANLNIYPTFIRQFIHSGHFSEAKSLPRLRYICWARYIINSTGDVAYSYKKQFCDALGIPPNALIEVDTLEFCQGDRFKKYAVRVPMDMRPGQLFHVSLENRIFSVVLPDTVRPGERILVRAPMLAPQIPQAQVAPQRYGRIDQVSEVDSYTPYTPYTHPYTHLYSG